MISWIQHHLIRHGRWVFLTLLAVIIVAFVFTIGNTPGCTTDRSGHEENLFYGVDLNAPRDRELLIEKVSMSAFLNGQQFRTDQQFQSALMSRVAMLNLADETGVPGPSDVALGDFIRSKAAFRGADGEFSPDAYTRFVDSVESNPRAPKGTVIVVLNEDYRISQVQEALSGPGYMLPSEAVAQAQANQTEFELSIAEVSYAEFTPLFAPSDEELLAYFEATKQRYEIPERIEASYVQFKTEDFLDQVGESTDAELRQHFAEGRAEFVSAYEAANPPTDDAVGGEENPAVTFDLVRDAVAESFAQSRASRLANEAAQAFAYKLYIEEVERESATFNQLINEYGLQLIEIEPYTLAGARQRMLSAELLESAFGLSGSRYYSDAYEVDGGFAVLIYEGRIAPEIPPYENVAVELKSNYQTEEKRRLFNENGEALMAEIEASLEAGTSFSDAAEALELSVQSFDMFTPTTAPSELNRSALSQAQRMEVGTVSPMLTLGDKGTFVYLAAKNVPEVDADNDDFERAQQMLKNWAAFSTQSELVNELILRGLPEGTVE